MILNGTNLMIIAKPATLSLRRLAILSALNRLLSEQFK
jgi:hypothetical protein